MKLTVVGFWGGFPQKNEATSGYLLECDGFKLLVDCGSSVLSQLQNYISPSELDAVIVSHYHHDHVADIGVLQYARMVGGAKIPLPIYGHTFDQDGFSKLSYRNITTAIEYNPNEVITIGPFTISFMKTHHLVPCYAMRIEAGNTTVVYTADSSYLPEFIPFSKDADLLICECNLYAGKELVGVHMNSEDAGNIASQANVKKLLLTHLPNRGNVNDLVKEAGQIFQGSVELACSGYVFEK